ncbi:MAG: acetylornithine deacetylase [Gammaproteobacteria bacterium]
MATTLPSPIDMMAALIAVPTISSVNPEFDMPNRAAVDLLATWLDELGFRIEIMPLDNEGKKANLLATLGSGEHGLVLAGHTDTVPYDQRAWNSDPFCLVEADERLYGLGTADMKAFLAIAVHAAGRFASHRLQQPLSLLATADEESGMDGAAAFSERGRAPGRYAVIGEPTGLRPVNLHKGVLMEAIRLQGRSGHSSDPSLGESALEGMHQVITRLLAWRAALQAQHRNGRFDVPVPTMNLGRIQGGDNPNRICGECELQLDLRPLPGMDIEALRQALRSQVYEALAGTRLKATFNPFFQAVPALETSPNSAIVRAAEALTGKSAGAVAFGTEGPFLNRMGMESVILGPGDVAQAHQPNEFVRRSQIGPTIELLEALIHRFCVTPEDQ